MEKTTLVRLMAAAYSGLFVGLLAGCGGDDGPAPLFGHIEVVGGYIWLSREAVPFFAGDVDVATQDLIHVTQGPANAALFATPLDGEPAWKSKPSYYLLATQDGAIQPAQQRAMAGKMGAQVTEVASSHVPMLSHPDAVVAMINQAAATL